MSPKHIPIKYKDEYLCSNTQFDTQVESVNLSKNTTLNLNDDDEEDESDMEEFEIIIDLSTFKSKRCYPNEAKPEKNQSRFVAR